MTDDQRDSTDRCDLDQAMRFIHDVWQAWLADTDFGAQVLESFGKDDDGHCDSEGREQCLEDRQAEAAWEEYLADESADNMEEL